MTEYMTVSVVDVMNGETFIVRIPSAAKTSELKSAIAEEAGVHVLQQKVFCLEAGEEPLRDTSAVHESGVTDGGQVLLLRENLLPHPASLRFDNGDTLWSACKRGDLSAVERCLDEHGNGACMVPDFFCRTPFYYACLCRHTRLVRFLLARGAEDVDGTAFICTSKEIETLLRDTGHQKSGKKESVYRGML